MTLVESQCSQDLVSSKAKITLNSIPGIGKKIKERLLDYYLNEESALNAIKSIAIGSVPGISFNQALKFAQIYYEKTENISKKSILITPDIEEIYDDIIGIIETYTRTQYSKLKLRLYFPLPSDKISLIYDRQQYFNFSLKFVKKYKEFLDQKGFSNLLSVLDTLKRAEEIPQIKSRIILTDSQKILEFLKDENIDDLIPLEFLNLSKISDYQHFFDKYSKNFDVVVYCGDNSQKIPSFSNLIIVSSQEINIENLIPEKIIKIFGLNKNVIQSMVRIVISLKSLKEESLISNFINEFDIKIIKTLKDNTSILDQKGEILSSIDLKLDDLRKISDNFASYVAEVESWINDSIKSEIGERTINIQGKQILDLIRSDISMEQIRGYIPSEVDDIIEEIIHKGIEKLRKLLNINKNEEDLLLKIIPEIIEFPIQFNDQEINNLEKSISANLNTYKYSAMIKIAKKLKKTYYYLLKLHQTLLDFDFFYSIGEFAYEYGLTIPEISNEYSGFYGKNMNNLVLLEDTILNNSKQPIPITYILGDFSNHDLEKNPCNRLNLLTGSNSGGKTMCINTCSQAIILGQMGFPSLGEITFSPFDELYYYKKSSGQLSAGAFETTLLQFVQLAQSPKKKIVFADELESITEPNAASKVLAGIFSLLLKNKLNFGVFVTHLAELLRKEMPRDTVELVRIDGIEAKGLDKNLELIVDRNPKFNYIAKSTPELILTKLAQSGSSEQKSFFSSILMAFK